MKRILLLFLVLFLSGNCFGAAVAQWKMNDDADDNTVVDSVGTYTGTFHGLGGIDDYTSAHNATGHINGGLELEINDYITVSDAAAFTPNGTAFSITAWVSLGANNGAADFSIVNKMGTEYEWLFGLLSDSLYFVLYDESAAQASIGRSDDADYSLYEGSGFLFFVATYDGGTSPGGVKLYLDALQVDDSNVTTGTFVNIDNSNEDVYIGQYSTGTPEGIIDNLVIYNTELTQAEITTLYNDGSGTESTTGTTAGHRSRYSNSYRSSYRNRYN